MRLIWLGIIGLLAVVIFASIFWYFNSVPSIQFNPSQQVSARSESPGYNLSIVDQQRFDQYLITQGFFKPNSVFLHSQKVSVRSVIFILTSHSQPDIFYASKKEGIYVAFGQEYNSKTSVMAIYLYVSPTYLSQQTNLKSASLTVNSYLLTYLDNLLHGKQDSIHQAQLEYSAMQAIKRNGLLFSLSK